MSPPVPAPAPVPLDAIARAIIEQLREDGRRPYGAIGRAVGLSEAAVRQRVQRLVEQGVVRIVAVTDPERLGLRRRATVGVVADGDPRVVAAALAEVPEVVGVVVTAGTFDLLVEVVCADDAHLAEVLGSRVRTLDGVRTTQTFVHLSPDAARPRGSAAPP